MGLLAQKTIADRPIRVCALIWILHNILYQPLGRLQMYGKEFKQLWSFQRPSLYSLTWAQSS